MKPRQFAGIQELARAALRFMVCALTFGQSAAWAQRGADYDVYTAPPSGPSSGFLGFFDSDQLAKGAFTGELPSFSVDYGVTDRWSIGTNALSVLGLSLGVPNLLLKSRYIFYSDGKVVSSLTGYFGTVWGDISKGQGVILGLLTSNTSVWIDRRQALGVSLLTGVLEGQLGEQGKVNYTRISANGLVLASSYRYVFSESGQIEALVGVPALANVFLDSTSGSVSLESGLGFVRSGGLFGRLSMDFLITRNILLSPQAYFGVSLSDPNTIGALPFISAIFRVGGE
jgi:hypothetical protein